MKDDPGPHSTFKLTTAVYDVQPDADGIPWLTEARNCRQCAALTKRGAVRGSGRAGFTDGRQRSATPAQWIEEDREKKARLALAESADWRADRQTCC